QCGAEADEAHRLSQELHATTAQEILDAGGNPATLGYSPEKDPVLLKYAEKWADHNPRVAHDRLTRLASALYSRYQREGEPKDLLAKRTELRAAQKARAPLAKAVADAKAAYQFCRDTETEEAIHKAIAALNAAESTVDRIKREIQEQFALNVL